MYFLFSDGKVHGAIPPSGRRGRAYLYALLSWLFLLDYKKGGRPQPNSCQQVASSEACSSLHKPPAHLATRVGFAPNPCQNFQSHTPNPCQIFQGIPTIHTHTNLLGTSGTFNTLWEPLMIFWGLMKM